MSAPATAPAKLFGVSCQQIMADVHKQQIIMTIEKSGFVHGTRMHTILTDSHKAILSKHTFYISTRTRAPSWWLVLTKIDGRAKAVLVEPLRVPKLYIWPGRWDESLCEGDGTVFAVQCPEAASDAKNLVIEELYLSAGLTWAENPFAERWKAAGNIIKTQYVYDAIINPVKLHMKKYYPMTALEEICKKGSLVEFMPNDCGKRRFLFEINEMAIVKVPATEEPVALTPSAPVVVPDVLFKTFGLVYEPALPDTYYLCEPSNGTFIIAEDGQKIKALVRILATSRMLYKQYQNAPDKTYIWKCKWIVGLNRWEPYEFSGEVI